MPRPVKDGLEYFPFDIDFFYDEKIEAISGEFGIKGEIIAIRLLCAIYRNGYFIEWSDMLRMKLLKSLPGVSSALLDSIVNRLAKWEFFDENLFSSTKILTSKGIQKRYEEATKRRKNDKNRKYWLLEIVNVNNNPPSTVVNATLTPQSKVKESKGKESPRERAPEFPDLKNSNLYKKPRVPTLEEVQMCFVRNGGNIEMAESFYNSNQSTDWFWKGSAIGNFTALVPNYIKNWKKNELKKNETIPDKEAIAAARSRLEY